jgi:fimbrial chaperone protein
MLARALFFATLAALFALLAGMGHAQAFQVRPVRLDLGARQPASQLLVTNPTARTLLIQAEAFDWSQDKDQEILNPSTNLIVNPPIFELAPGAQQVVRVGMRRAIEGGVQKHHRVWLSQVATPGADSESGVQMLLRVSLPVFVTGSGTGAPQAVWHRQAVSGAIELGNSGQRHLHVRELRLLAEGEKTATLGPCYALPGGLCRWQVPADWRNKVVHIEADSDAGILRSKFETGPPN